MGNQLMEGYMTLGLEVFLLELVLYFKFSCLNEYEAKIYKYIWGMGILYVSVGEDTWNFKVTFVLISDLVEMRYWCQMKFWIIRGILIMFCFCSKIMIIRSSFDVW